jgi:hypothetical protein
MASAAGQPVGAMLSHTCKHGGFSYLDGIVTPALRFALFTREGTYGDSVEDR